MEYENKTRKAIDIFYLLAVIAFLLLVVIVLHGYIVDRMESRIKNKYSERNTPFEITIPADVKLTLIDGTLKNDTNIDKTNN